VNHINFQCLFQQSLSIFTKSITICYNSRNRRKWQPAAFLLCCRHKCIVAKS